MKLWHLTSDAPRLPHRVSPGTNVQVHVGTWPIAPGQRIWVDWRADLPDGDPAGGRVEAAWARNEGENSYWIAQLGPFAHGTTVSYTVSGADNGAVVEPPVQSGFRVRPALYLAFCWHQHQPLYGEAGEATRSYSQPWVRLHAIRDYYSMAALVGAHPGVHLTINLTPVLLSQITRYADGATDRPLELTRTSPDRLTPDETEELLGSFFDADWHHQIFPHPRYRQLFERRAERLPFSTSDLRDLQMWFNLAWFGKEFREGIVTLITGEAVSVRRFVEQGAGFRAADIEEMIAEQYKILRAVIPIHRHLLEAGQIEVSSTPFYHPILPLLIDTQRATIDRPGAELPVRLATPEDAENQVRLAVDHHRAWFGRPPRGMWPAEGAVAQFALPFFARNGLEWTASDQGVLARSGRWGYRADDPEVLCQPYRGVEDGQRIGIFFRHTHLSDAIGFHFHRYEQQGDAARAFLQQVKAQVLGRLTSDEDRVLSVILDGENAWGAYAGDARVFLDTLYGLLEADPEITTVTFAEYLDGASHRHVASHPVDTLRQVHDLFTGSWIDEQGSASGVDLGTWAGEAEENRAWALLRDAHEAVARAGVTPESAPGVFHALYAAEGSDWFWWFGSDQDSGSDAVFDDLFRSHLSNVYSRLGVQAPEALHHHIVARPVVWTFSRPADRVGRADTLVIQTNCPGNLHWRPDDALGRTVAMEAVGGVMAGVGRYRLTLGPFPHAGTVSFRFECLCGDPRCVDASCHAGEQRLPIVP